MARYTDEQEISFDFTTDYRPIIVDGSVTIYANDGDDWVQTDIKTTGAYPLFTKGLVLRFVPDSGASYSIDGGIMQ